MNTKDKLVFLLSLLLISFSLANAETKIINLVNANGQVIEQRRFEIFGNRETINVAERMKYNWFCLSKRLFNSLYCELVDSGKLALANTAKVPNENILNTNVDNPNSFQQQNPSSQTLDLSDSLDTTLPSNNQPSVVYQVIERAVPGPQGPAGRDGKDATNAVSGNTISSMFPNTNTGAQYIGFGASTGGSVSSVDPTGNANLSTISGIGLSTCNSTTSKILYNSTTKLFECGTDLNTGGGGFSGGDLYAQNVFATTSLQTPIIFASTTNSTTTNSFTTNTTNLISTNSTLTNSTSTNIFSTNASLTNATATNLFVNNASLTFATSTYLFANTILNTNLISTNSTLTNSTSTNLFSTNASLTNATTTNFFTAMLNALVATITDLVFTNATGTNATTTNFFSNNLTTFDVFNTNLTSTGTFALATGTISSTSILYANITNLFFNNTLGVLATFTSGTATDWYSTNLWANNASITSASTSNLISANATFSYATVTNGFFTNLSVSGPLAAALTNGLTFRGSTGNISEATTTIFVANSGKVGVGGTTTPSEALSVNGNLLVSGNMVAPKFSNLPTSGADQLLCIDGSGNVTVDSSANCYGLASSDIRLKQNIATVTSTLEKVKGLSTVNFNWIDESRGTSTQLGYIAQDVQKVFPEVVKQDENGFLKVNYISLSAIYANAIKELDTLVFTQINEIINRLSRNEVDILNLKTRVSDLESRLGAPTVNTPELTPQTPIDDVTTLKEEGKEDGTEAQVETGTSDISVATSTEGI